MHRLDSSFGRLELRDDRSATASHSRQSSATSLAAPASPVAGSPQAVASPQPSSTPAAPQMLRTPSATAEDMGSFLANLARGF